MPPTDGSQSRVYQARIVDKNLGEVYARNLFADPDTAKRYLAGYVQIRWSDGLQDWRVENSAEEKWSTYTVRNPMRAVVMKWDVYESEQGPLDRVREVTEARADAW